MPDAHVRLKRRNLLLMIVFSLLTLGLYYPIWFLRRRAALNQLDSQRKLPIWPFLVAFAYMGATLLGAAFDPTPGVPGGAFTDSLLFLIVRFAVAILMVMQAFAVKDILEDHLAGPDDTPAIFRTPVTLSGVLTFILGMFYLQHAINTNLDALIQMPGSTPTATVTGVE